MSRHFKDVYIFNDNDNMFCVMGIYKGIRILIKVFETREAAQNYIDNGIL